MFAVRSAIAFKAAAPARAAASRAAAACLSTSAVAAAKKVHVSNLPWAADERQLSKALSSFGEITDCVILRERDTGRSRGFGFVTFTDDAAADRLVNELPEVELLARRLDFKTALTQGSGFNRSEGRGFERRDNYNNNRGEGRSRDNNRGFQSRGDRGYDRSGRGYGDRTGQAEDGEMDSFTEVKSSSNYNRPADKI
ncbi:hypothetical protein HK105_200218 [Polyrhizophydium stewartii]|uniref:RRM domain-containing protein n=1 Tax=Polyrhizophydium stewartii TaxID=2732419 RepID=A0ABR4NKU4_9FUNG|nr:hypothetical protein HK105_001114 [Polyrhizophydium stewartii]